MTFDHRCSQNKSELHLFNIMSHSEKRKRKWSRFGCSLYACYVSSQIQVLFSSISVTQYDIRAFHTRQGKEYRVIDGIINSVATESHDVRSIDRYRLQVDKFLSRRHSVKYQYNSLSDRATILWNRSHITIDQQR